MGSQKERTGKRASGRRSRIPRLAVLLDTAIAIYLCGVGAYHFTQPNQAWRSGTTELVCAALLLLAAYRLSRTQAMVIHLIVAVPVFALGIRHLIHGGGWQSGVAELFFALLLVAIAVIIRKVGGTRRT